MSVKCVNYVSVSSVDFIIATLGELGYQAEIRDVRDARNAIAWFTVRPGKLVDEGDDNVLAIDIVDAPPAKLQP